MMTGEAYTDGQINIRPFVKEDLPQMIDIWNEIVADGRTFPQEKSLNIESLDLRRQVSYRGVTETAQENMKISGLCITDCRNSRRKAWNNR